MNICPVCFCFFLKSFLPQSWDFFLCFSWVFLCSINNSKTINIFWKWRKVSILGCFYWLLLRMTWIEESTHRWSCVDLVNWKHLKVNIYGVRLYIRNKHPHISEYFWHFYWDRLGECILGCLLELPKPPCYFQDYFLKSIS